MIFFPMLIIVCERIKAGKLILGLMNTVVMWTTNSGFEALTALSWGKRYL